MAPKVETTTRADIQAAPEPTRRSAKSAATRVEPATVSSGSTRR